MILFMLALSQVSIKFRARRAARPISVAVETVDRSHSERVISLRIYHSRPKAARLNTVEGLTVFE